MAAMIENVENVVECLSCHDSNRPEWSKALQVPVQILSDKSIEKQRSM